jgi:hypothetical protein
MASIYEMEGGTAYVMKKTTAIYYMTAIKDASEWVALLPEHKDHGKRGKKGKSNKDWHK